MCCLGKIVSLAILLALPVAFVPSASAHDVCLFDLECVSTGLGDETTACPSVSFTATKPYYFEIVSPAIEGVRDPPFGLYYVGAWSYAASYERNASGTCVVFAESCALSVSEGSTFKYAKHRGVSSVSGEYKGVAAVGGTLTCTKACATLDTFLVGLDSVRLRGRCAS